MRRLLLCAVLVAGLVAPVGPSLVNPQSASATPVWLPRATWYECHGGPNVLEGPYRAGTRWLVDVVRLHRYTMTVHCR